MATTKSGNILVGARKWAVTVSAEGFDFELEDKWAKCGFVTVAHVEASDGAEAAERAINCLLDDVKVRGLFASREECRRALRVTRINEVSDFMGRRVPRLGLVFYPLDPDK